MPMRVYQWDHCHQTVYLLPCSSAPGLAPIAVHLEVIMKKKKMYVLDQTNFRIFFCNEDLVLENDLWRKVRNPRN